MEEGRGIHLAPFMFPVYLTNVSTLNFSSTKLHYCTTTLGRFLSLQIDRLWRGPLWNWEHCTQWNSLHIEDGLDDHFNKTGATLGTKTSNNCVIQNAMSEGHSWGVLVALTAHSEDLVPLASSWRNECKSYSNGLAKSVGHIRQQPDPMNWCDFSIPLSSRVHAHEMSCYSKSVVAPHIRPATSVWSFSQAVGVHRLRLLCYLIYFVLWTTSLKNSRRYKEEGRIICLMRSSGAINNHWWEHI